MLMMIVFVYGIPVLADSKIPNGAMSFINASIRAGLADLIIGE